MITAASTATTSASRTSGRGPTSDIPQHPQLCARGPPHALRRHCGLSLRLLVELLDRAERGTHDTGLVEQCRRYDLGRDVDQRQELGGLLADPAAYDEQVG